MWVVLSNETQLGDITVTGVYGPFDSFESAARWIENLSPVDRETCSFAPLEMIAPDDGV